MLLIKIAPALLYDHLHFTRGFAVVSTALSMALVARYVQSVWRIGNDLDLGLVADPAVPGTPSLAATHFRDAWLRSLAGQRWLVVLCCGSGFATLVYGAGCA